MDVPFGLGANPQSRALYGVDLMLRWTVDNSGRKTMQPMVLEYNFNPDTHRACKYHPHFYNDCFAAMFGDHVPPSVIPL